MRRVSVVLARDFGRDDRGLGRLHLDRREAGQRRTGLELGQLAACRIGSLRRRQWRRARGEKQQRGGDAQRATPQLAVRDAARLVDERRAGGIAGGGTCREPGDGRPPGCHHGERLGEAIRPLERCGERADQCRGGVDAIEQVAHQLTEESYPPGQRILRQGFSGTGFYVILDGEVAIRIDGEERARLSKGDFFGEMSVLLGKPASAGPQKLKAGTVVDKTYLESMPREQWLEIRLQDDEAFIRQVSGINYNTPDTGWEAGYEGGPWSAQLAVTRGTAGGPAATVPSAKNTPPWQGHIKN